MSPLSTGNTKSKDSLTIQCDADILLLPQMNCNFIVLVGKRKAKRGDGKEKINKSMLF